MWVADNMARQGMGKARQITRGVQVWPAILVLGVVCCRPEILMHLHAPQMSILQ